MDVHALDKVSPQLDMIAGNPFKVVLKKTVATGETNPCEIRGTKRALRMAILPGGDQKQT